MLAVTLSICNLSSKWPQVASLPCAPSWRCDLITGSRLRQVSALNSTPSERGRGAIEHSDDMASNQDLRQRSTTSKSQGTPASSGKAEGSASKKSSGASVIDVLRILGGLFLLNCLLSYFITNDSVLWGYRPWFVRPGLVMRYIVSWPHLLLHEYR